MDRIRRYLDNVSLPTRLTLALVPSALPALVFLLLNWQPNCFFNEAWYCIYYFHPPFMDVLFALVVLAPFAVTCN